MRRNGEMEGGTGKDIGRGGGVSEVEREGAQRERERLVPA